MNSVKWFRLKINFKFSKRLIAIENDNKVS